MDTDYEVYIQSLTYTAASYLPVFVEPDYPIECMGSMCEAANRHLRTLANALAFQKEDPNIFIQNLIRSGLTQQAYLQRCQNEDKIEVSYQHITECSGMLDALAAGDFGLARSIASLLSEYNREEDKRDEQYYFKLFIQKTLSDPKQNLDSLLQEYEKSLNGEKDGAFEICKALSTLDQDKFNSGIQRLLEEHKDWVENGSIEGDTYHEFETRICIDALGLLRLAESLCLKTKEEYPFCPKISRTAATVPFPINDPAYPGHVMAA